MSQGLLRYISAAAAFARQLASSGEVGSPQVPISVKNLLECPPASVGLFSLHPDFASLIQESVRIVSDDIHQGSAVCLAFRQLLARFVPDAATHLPPSLSGELYTRLFPQAARELSSPAETQRASLLSVLCALRILAGPAELTDRDGLTRLTDQLLLGGAEHPSFPVLLRLLAVVLFLNPQAAPTLQAAANGRRVQALLAPLLDSPNARLYALAFTALALLVPSASSFARLLYSEENAEKSFQILFHRLAVIVRDGRGATRGLLDDTSRLLLVWAELPSMQRASLHTPIPKTVLNFLRSLVPPPPATLCLIAGAPSGPSDAAAAGAHEASPALTLLAALARFRGFRHQVLAAFSDRAGILALCAAALAPSSSAVPGARLSAAISAAVLLMDALAQAGPKGGVLQHSALSKTVAEAAAHLFTRATSSPRNNGDTKPGSVRFFEPDASPADDTLDAPSSADTRKSQQELAAALSDNSRIFLLAAYLARAAEALLQMNAAAPTDATTVDGGVWQGFQAACARLARLGFPTAREKNVQLALAALFEHAARNAKGSARLLDVSPLLDPVSRVLADPSSARCVASVFAGLASLHHARPQLAVSLSQLLFQAQRAVSDGSARTHAELGSLQRRHERLSADHDKLKLAHEALLARAEQDASKSELQQVELSQRVKQFERQVEAVSRRAEATARKSDELEEERAQARQALQAATRENSRLKHELAATRSELEDQREAARHASSESHVVREQLEAAERRTRELCQSAEEMSLRIEPLEELRRRLQAECGSLKSELEATTKRAADAQKAFEASEYERAILAQKVESLSERLEMSTRDLVEAKQRHQTAEKAGARLQEAVEAARAACKRTEARLAEKEEECYKAGTDLEAAQTDLSCARTSIAELEARERTLSERLGVCDQERGEAVRQNRVLQHHAEILAEEKRAAQEQASALALQVSTFSKAISLIYKTAGDVIEQPPGTK